MRVGVIGPIYPDSFADNVAAALPNVGMEPVLLGPSLPSPPGRFLRVGAGFVARQTAETLEFFQRALLRRVKERECEIILNLDQSLMPRTVEKIKRRTSRVALWYPDSIAQASRMAMIASNYDALFIKDPLFVDRLSKVYGLPAVYMPEACNPQWHRPIGEPGSEPFIVVVGSLYPTRARLLQRLYDAGVPLKLYGMNFPRWYDPGPLRRLHTNSYVSREGKSRVFREARGVLNNLHPAEMSSVNCRLFEAAAAGAAVLCEERPTLQDLFEIDREVLAFKTFDGLVELCQRLLSEPGLMQQIGDAATERAHADHSYEIRLSAILDRLI